MHGVASGVAAQEPRAGGALLREDGFSGESTIAVGKHWPFTSFCFSLKILVLLHGLCLKKKKKLARGQAGGSVKRLPHLAAPGTVGVGSTE